MINWLSRESCLSITVQFYYTPDLASVIQINHKETATEMSQVSSLSLQT